MLCSTQLILEIRGFDPGPLAEVISKFTPVPIPYKDPIDWARWITVAIALLGATFLLYIMSPLVQSRWPWAVVTVVMILVMTGGFMFARIRNVPYTGNNGQWVAAGFSHQFGQEVQVVAFICKRSLPFIDFLYQRFRRWSIIFCLCHVDYGGSVSDITSETTHADLPVDCRHHDHVLCSRFSFQGEKRRYVHPAGCIAYVSLIVSARIPIQTLPLVVSSTFIHLIYDNCMQRIST